MSANAILTQSKPQPVFSNKRAPEEWRSLPTRILVVDLETHGLGARFDPDVHVYCGSVVQDWGDGSRKPKMHSFVRWEPIVDFLQPLLNEGWALVVHNAKFDIPVLTCRGLKIDYRQVYCTQTLAYLQNNTLPSYSLDALMPGSKIDVVELLVKDGVIDKQTKAEFWAEDWSGVLPVVESMQEYCVGDTKACHKLYLRLQKKADENFCIAYHRTEQPMLAVLVQLERNGLPIDKDLLVASISKYRQEVEQHKRTIDERFGLLPELEWNNEEEQFVPKEKTYAKGYYANASTLVMDYYSPNAVSFRDWGGYAPDGSFVQNIDDGSPVRVYNHCKLKPYNAASATGHTWWLISKHCPQALNFVGKTPSGRPQVNKEFLQDVAEHLPEDFPVARLAKATKKLQMLEGYWNHLSYSNRVHPDFQHTQTLTGRLATSRPNMQNVPRAGEDEESQIFRKLVRAPQGKRMALADLDQIELRVLAYYLQKAVGDSSMADEFQKPDADPHTANATKWQVKRTVAKTLIFLLIYGGQPALMVKRKLFATLAEAEAAFKNVHESQPSIKQLMELVVESATKKGYVQTLGGRKLYYPNLRSSNRSLKSKAVRQCFNALIQGGARDIIHQLAVETEEVVACYGTCARLVNIIHDEIIVEVDECFADALVADLNLVWQNRLDLLPGVRVNGDWHHGSTWLEAK
jgi:DNA polymerase I-like protein with 3'-5' exonuclease and polymerase domains